MKRPFTIDPNDEVTQVGKVFGTPVVVKGLTWFPLVELITWLLMAWYAGKKRPERSWRERLGIGALTMPVLLGSEWCHNLSHVLAARLVGKPMDALSVTFGMPLCIYYDIEDASVSPRQHIYRALAGPLFNALILPVISLFRASTRRESIAREVADVALGTNVFLSTASLLPLPGIDGGPILKWALVDQGFSPCQADETVRRVDGILAPFLAIGCALAYKMRQRLISIILGLFALTSLGLAKGWIQEQ